MKTAAVFLVLMLATFLLAPITLGVEEQVDPNDLDDGNVTGAGVATVVEKTTSHKRAIQGRRMEAMFEDDDPDSTDTPGGGDTGEGGEVGELEKRKKKKPPPMQGRGFQREAEGDVEEDTSLAPTSTPKTTTTTPAGSPESKSRGEEPMGRKRDVVSLVTLIFVLFAYVM